MPGVVVQTATRSGPSTNVAPGDARYFVAGLTERGSTAAAIRVRSVAEVETFTGGRVSYGAVYDDLRVYFEEGGAEAWIARVVGPAATVGLLTLLDRAAVTPVATVRIEAASVGAWSTRVTVAVEAGSNANTIKLRVYLDAVLAETFDNLASPAEVVDTLAVRSAYVVAVNLGSATAAPLNNPAVLAATPLSAGTDDRAAVNATIVGNTLDRFSADLGAGAIATPGYASSQTGVALRSHAQANRRLALTATAVGATPAEAITAADTLASSTGEFVGLFYPWVRISTGGTTSKLVSPEGYVAAVRNRAHREDGPWRVPAGQIAKAAFLLGVERELTRAQGDALDEERVSAIRTINGATCLYGWRSLSTDEQNYALLNGRDVLNFLASEAEARLERYVFLTVDGKGILFRDIEAELVGLLDPIRNLGGLYERRDESGGLLDPGYSVDVGPAVNTPAVLAANEVRATVAVRVSPVGSLISVTIVKAAFGATV